MDRHLVGRRTGAAGASTWSTAAQALPASGAASQAGMAPAGPLVTLGGLAIAAMLALPHNGAVSCAQEPQDRGAQDRESAEADVPPSLRKTPRGGLPRSGAGTSGTLPQGHGQEHRVYDLRPYTGYLSKHDSPHQAVVDWVLRETGSDLWFTEPFGFLSADRDSLSVYHTPEVHDVVAKMVERFTAGEKDPQVMNLRVMTVGSPNWRRRTHMLMQHVTVNSPGLQAWLLTRENAAMVLSMLRQRSDVHEIQTIDMVTHNGQTEKLASTRGRNYVKNVRPAPSGWPPYEPQTGEIEEGFRLEISPLLSLDRSSVDCVIQCEIDQVDKLVPVDLDLPLPSSEMFRARVDVPQVVSWRLKERFRWPADMVLLLSCGVVASPERSASSIPFVNLSSITGTTAGRADALMFIEFRGRTSENLPQTPRVSDRIGTANRGRY